MKESVIPGSIWRNNETNELHVVYCLANDADTGQAKLVYRGSNGQMRVISIESFVEQFTLAFKAGDSHAAC